MRSSVRARQRRRTSLSYARIFWKWSAVGYALPTTINLPKSSKTFASPSSDRQSMNKPPRIVMSEIVIVALASFLIGITAAALIVQLVP
jgi:hypothetical protein